MPASRTVGMIALNNSRALNALTLDMFHAIERQLLAWRERDESLAWYCMPIRLRRSVPVAMLKHW